MIRGSTWHLVEQRLVENLASWAEKVYQALAITARHSTRFGDGATEAIAPSLGASSNLLDHFKKFKVC